MTIKFTWIRAVAAGGLAALGAGAAGAAAEPQHAQGLASPAHQSAAAGRVQMPLAQLETISARQGVSIDVRSSQVLSATNSGNSIGGDLTSGAVSFSDQALSGFSGVGNFVVNTGANNNLQGSITVNVVGLPTP